ncbi:MAG TPA: septum formation initiator family protein [Nocardioidaceae bacterium]|nr:septum formation initiator family protein [Nocardioidaceae bacterium]
MRPRLTGRAAVLVLVVSVLMVSYASSFRAYLEQRTQLQQLQAEIAESNASIKELEREKERWKDPAYTEAAARKAFGWVMPGETGFTVIDENGQPLQPVDSLSDPRVSTDGGVPEWYDAAWGSVLLAGNPPEPEDEPQPVGTIKPRKSP